MREVLDTDKITFLYIEELPEEGAMAVCSYPTKDLSQGLRDHLIQSQNFETDSVILVTVSNEGEISTAIRNGKAPHPFVIDNQCVARIISTLRNQLQMQKSYSVAR